MKAIFAAAVLSIAGAIWADRINTRVETPDWSVESSECIWAGARHTSYPLWHLMDGRPETAWAFSGLAYPKLTPEAKSAGVTEEFWIRFVPARPTAIDELRIMNGYNKSDAHFFRNSRVTEIKIFDSYPYEYSASGDVLRTPVRTVALSDKPGMKSVRVPKKRYTELYVLFSGITKGQIDDLCVSEMMPRSGGRDLITYRGVMLFGYGSDCG